MTILKRDKSPKTASNRSKPAKPASGSRPSGPLLASQAVKSGSRRPPTASATLRIRPLVAADIAAAEALVLAVFEEASIDCHIERHFGGVPWAQIKGAAVRALAQADVKDAIGGCFVAVSGGRIAGYVSTSINRVASRGTICDLAVAADFQGQGVGAKLIARALRFFRKMKLHHAKIETLETNLAGRHLYPKMGFVEMARQVHYAMPLRKIGTKRG